ncbi:MAG: methylated-DNA--[protein]-cysteine S-methyltransferase [Terracidiphilus sp.]|jgi:AraC family transcriptional regulator of adaptative response/methylated-DNA-[protein]-cysteine methyltransferase
MVLMKGKSQMAGGRERPAAHSLEATPAIDPEAAWRQLLARDPAAAFFYAVTTTGVFCRPGCKSRRPLRVNVRFFLSASEARAAGFRPCQRCHPSAAAQGSPLERVRAHIEANLDHAAPLKELGRVAGLSPFTVQRLFKRAMGVTPLEYHRALRAARLRGALKHGGNVTDAIYEAGFGSSSRAYEGAALGMTPGRFARGGRGERIAYTTARSPFGWLVVGATERGLCWLALGSTATEAETSLRAEFPLAELRRDPSLAGLVDAAVGQVVQVSEAGRGSGPDAGQSPVLDLRGTAFQLRVWQVLRAIPRGETRSYSQLARELGEPKAVRAVARACATNRVALVVPCHRVVGASGELTGYRWGVERKRQLLEAEGHRS